MITYFPTTYFDELLYSMIARCHVRSGNTSPKATIEDLFGSRTATAVMDMPCNIDSLTSKLPLFMNLKAEDIILRHTLFPYYTAFLPNVRVKTVKKSMKGDFGGDIHTMTGIMASSIKVPEYLRFCPECNKEDFLVHGEYYWHRIHQIPGVLICPKHNTIIQDSSVKVHGINKHEFIAADEYNCISNLTTIEYSNNDIEILSAIARDVLWLIENYETIRTAEGVENGFRGQYLSILMEKGLATSTGRVYQEEFIKSFRNFYGDNLLNVAHSAVEYDFENNWLSSIVRKHRKSFHPLRHLLLIRYLTGNVESFFETKKQYLPFGVGPWPCLNAAAEHFGNLVIDNLAITHCSDTKLPVGTFECSCGFIYSRRGLDKSKDDCYKIGRIKRFGPVWKHKLRELVENEKLGMRATAKRLKVDANTVNKYVKLLGLNAVWETHKIIPVKNVGNGLLNSEKELEDYHRHRWLELKASYSEASKTELREMDKATYVWLYRHDRYWLDRNSPLKRTSNSQYCRIDWASRDIDVLNKVKKATDEISTSNSKPERITIGRIGRKAGLLSLLEKHLDKMPITNKYITRIVESDDQYAIRRVRWATNELIRHDEALREWKIIRMAGIRSGYSEKVKLAIYREIDNYNNSKTNKGMTNA